MKNPSLVEYRSFHMGGWFHFKVYLKDSQNKNWAINVFKNCCKEIERIENLLTDFKKSPITEINEMAGIKEVIVPEESFYVIHKSLEISKKTKGLFDISYAGLGHLYRKAKKTKTLPSHEEIEEAKRYINYKKIIIDERKKSIYLPFSQMKIGLGGIGKGYGVDKAFEFCIKKGLSNFFINGQGDIRVHTDEFAKRPWKIGMRNPFSIDENKSMGGITLRSGSFATSGTYIKKENINDRSIHHIIHPKTGEFSDEIISISVLGEDALNADTFATSSMLMGVKKAKIFLDKHKMLGVILDDCGKVHLTNKSMNSLKN